jgi:hypothetical protein
VDPVADVGEVLERAAGQERPGPADACVVGRRAEVDVALLEQHRAGDAAQSRGERVAVPAPILEDGGQDVRVDLAEGERPGAECSGVDVGLSLGEGGEESRGGETGRREVAHGREPGALGPDGEVLVVERAEARALIPDVETVTVKEGLARDWCRALAPEVARASIRAGAGRAPPSVHPPVAGAARPAGFGEAVSHA